MAAVDWIGLAPWGVAALSFFGTIIAAWFAWRSSHENNATALIDRYAEALKSCEKKQEEAAHELAVVRRANWDNEEKIEVLEVTGRENERRITKLEHDLVEKTQRADELQRQVDTLTAIIDRRNTPRGGLMTP